jgi:uncharacterized protein DUF3810
MMNRRFWVKTVLLFLFCVAIHLFSASHLRTEIYYSNGIYCPISKLLRTFSGLLPYSIGDIIYGILFVWIIIKIVELIGHLIRGDAKPGYWEAILSKLIRIVLWIYIVFNIFWGINYNREGIAYQLGLPERKYTIDDLKQLNGLLLQKLNESKKALLQNPDSFQNNNELFNKAIASYGEAAKKYSFLTYKDPAVKSSMWGWLGNYLGFTGYYNPFTGEAQVNTTVPIFLQPYTTCHEMAHQLGYAKEDEANFVGYLSASASTDTFFRYSVYLDLFLTANRNLRVADSLSAKVYRKQLLPEVVVDIKTWRSFLMQHDNPVEPLITWMYGKYLQSNQQPSGVLSYDEVTGLLIEYYKKYGTI